MHCETDATCGQHGRLTSSFPSKLAKHCIRTHTQLEIFGNISRPYITTKKTPPLGWRHPVSEKSSESRYAQQTPRRLHLRGGVVLFRKRVFRIKICTSDTQHLPLGGHGDSWLK